MTNVTEKLDPYAFGVWMFFGGLAAGAVVVAVLFAYARDSWLIPNSSVAYRETSMAVGLLSDQKRPLQPQLREYLKARVYLNVLTELPVRWTKDMRTDFGPLDEKILGDVSFTKGDLTTSDLYPLAMNKLRYAN
ncbi:MAG: hypothetical protein JNJ55_14840 [Betaproteobacteria bacterium]|nr:hypothetical protein [Betaproteobacteria bacterium]